MEFRTGVIRPVECVKEGWELIKDDYWLFFAITLIGMLLAGLIPIVGIGVMFCGIYICLLQKMNGQKVEFEALFKGFSFLVPSLIATLIIIIPNLIFVFFMGGSIGALFFSLTNSRRAPNPSDLYILFGTIMIESVIFSLLLGCLHALIMFANPLIVERNLSGVDAFKVSARAVWRNLSGVVGIIALEFALGIVGYMLCAIGVYFTIPLMFAAVAVAYRKVFPVEPNDFARQNQPPVPPQFVNRGGYQ